MAGALKCEICGGKLIGKPGGIFECEYCGVEYSTAWAKEKIQEIKGTVKVEGTVEVTGKVQVEGAATKGSLLKRAKMCLEDEDWRSADKYCEKVLDVDPEYGEAYLYKFLTANMLRSVADIPKLLETYTGKAEITDIGPNRPIFIKEIHRITGYGITEIRQLLGKLPFTLDVTIEDIVRLRCIGATVSSALTVDEIKNNANYKKFIRFSDPARVQDIDSFFTEYIKSIDERAKEIKHQIENRGSGSKSGNK